MLALSPAVPAMCPTLFSTIAAGLAVEVGRSTFNDGKVMGGYSGARPEGATAGYGEVWVPACGGFEQEGGRVRGIFAQSILHSVMVTNATLHGE